MIATALVLLVAAIHLYFTYLETLAWEAPRTRAAFGTTAEFAASTRNMAINQGAYNGFLAVGLLVGLLAGSHAMVVYLLICVGVAGLVAMRTGVGKALYFQTLPATAALAATGFGL